MIMRAVIAVLLAVACPSFEQAIPVNVEDSMHGEKAGQERDDNGQKMKLIRCPPRSFNMENGELVEAQAKRVGVAADDNQPEDADEELEVANKGNARSIILYTPVKVFLTRGYWLGKFEVTQAEWTQVMESEPWKDRTVVAEENRKFIKEGGDFPAVCMTRDEAMDFCRKLTKQEGQADRIPAGWEYSLPTEAQWERACRARTETKYNFGDDASKLSDSAWFHDSVGAEFFAHRVGQKKPNSWGLHDIHGNVWEWCRGTFEEGLPGGRDPETKLGDFLVIRGGAWNFDAFCCRSAFRNGSGSGCNEYNLGFRVALTAVR
ncbi:MAG: formylglycine-generating enzyme family protein [Planctomycetales bacterium]